MNNRTNPDSMKDEVELSLSDILSMLKKYKVLLILVTSFFSISSIFYSLSLDKYYNASVLMTPAQGVSDSSQGLTGLLTGFSSSNSFGNQLSETEALAVLKSRSFLETFISSKGLMKELFYKDFDTESGNWISEEIPTLKDGYELLGDSMDIDLDRGLINLTIQSHDPQFSAFLTNSLIQEINDHLREESIQDSNKSISYLEKEIKKTSLSSSKEMLYGLIEQQIQSAMIANTQEDYVFRVLDPAVAPINPSGPNRRFIVTISTIFGFILSAFIALFLNFLNNYRSE